MAQNYSGSNALVSPKTKAPFNGPEVVALDSEWRTEPLHPLLPSIKLPKSTDVQDAATLNPVTLQPFSADDLKTHNFVALRNLYRNPDDARKAQEDAIKELKEKMAESELKLRELNREMEEKEKTREIERKIYLKKLGKESG